MRWNYYIVDYIVGRGGYVIKESGDEYEHPFYGTPRYSCESCEEMIEWLIERGEIEAATAFMREWL